MSMAMVMGAHAAGHGGDLPGYLAGLGKIHVPGKNGLARLLVKTHPVDAHVDNRCAGLDPVRLHQTGNASRDDQDVGPAAMFRQVFGAGMNHRHRGVGTGPLLAEHDGNGLADDIGTANDHDFGPGHFDAERTSIS